MRVLTTQIAFGFSPEARVVAQLASKRDGRYELLTLHNSWPGDRASAARCGELAESGVCEVDFGWRPPEFGRTRWQKARSRLRFRLALREALLVARAFAPDVIVSSQQKWDFRAARYLARQLKRPHIVHLHYNVGAWLGMDVVRGLRTADHVVAVSHYIRSDAIEHGVATGRITTLWNTMEPAPAGDPAARAAIRAELAIPAEAAVIGMAARFDISKHHDDLIEAFAAARGRFPDAWLVLAGDGPLRASIEQSAAKVEHVLFLGQRRDVPRLLRAFDIFAHPSIRDPCPLAVMEASFAGLPVVGYRDGGLPEIVLHEATGLLAPPRDVDELAHHLMTVLDKPELGRRLGEAGRQRMERHFRPEQGAPRFAAILESVVRSASPELSAAQFAGVRRV